MHIFGFKSERFVKSYFSRRFLRQLERSYRQQFHFKPYLIDRDGRVLNSGDSLHQLSEIALIRARALEECVHWGEPYIFLLAPGVVSWVIALANQYSVHGGLIGGEVVSKFVQADPSETLQHFQSLGLSAMASQKYVRRLESWPQARIREAIHFLEQSFYRMSGWKPLLLEENFSRALQQREIAHAIHEQKKSGKTPFYPLEKERLILSLLKSGDRRGCRRNLNDWLGALFFQTPRLPLLRARAIELLGYLCRALLEEAPLLESLLEINHRWVEKILEAESFEPLCQLMDQAISEFIDTIQAQTEERSNRKVAAILDFVRRNYRKKISLEMAAREAGLSTFRTAHLVKAITHKTLFQILQEVRIQKAQELLKKTTMSCTEIAYEVGYGEQSYFIRQFKRSVGVTPTRFRRR
jgi:two-component system response regulator YesN